MQNDVLLNAFKSMALVVGEFLEARFQEDRAAMVFTPWGLKDATEEDIEKYRKEHQLRVALTKLAETKLRFELLHCKEVMRTVKENEKCIK